jgi:LysM repeat protein
MVSDCDTFYLVVSGDSCAAIAASYDISLADFYAWNPAVGDTCSSLWVDDYVCVGVVGGASSTAVSTTTSSTTTTTSSGITTPTPYESGMVDDCDSFHLVVSGDECATIASDAGITLDEFYEWNPTVGDTCSSLWLDYYVCVGTE